MHCAQIPYEQTQAINQWSSVGNSPFSDKCLIQLTSSERYDDSGNLLVEDETRGIYLDCTYQEDIATASAQRRYAVSRLRLENIFIRSLLLELSKETTLSSNIPLLLSFSLNLLRLRSIAWVVYVCLNRGGRIPVKLG